MHEIWYHLSDCILNSKFRKRFGHRQSLGTYSLSIRISLPIRVSRIIKKFRWNYNCLPRRCIPDCFHRSRLCNGASCRVGSKIPLMWLTSGCRLGIQEGEQKRKNSKKQDGQTRCEDDRRGWWQKSTEYRGSLAVRKNAISLASLMHVVGSTRRIALIEEGHREELVGS